MKNDKNDYSISELASEFKVSTRTLRFYEEKGLLKPARNGQSRSYSAADRTRLRLILRGKRLGFSLDESQSIISMYDADKGDSKQLSTLINKIQEKRQQLEEQQKDLQIMIDDLNESEQKCRNALNKTTSND